MKKIIISLLFASSLSALDFSAELKSSYRLENFEESSTPIEAKLFANYGEEDFFTEFAIIANGSEENPVEIYRAYVELYKDDLTISLGRQMLLWGNTFIFNGANVFNKIDIEDPRAESIGVDSLRLKYNLTDLSRAEAIVFDNGVSNDNYGFRYTFTLSNFEVMANYLNYKKEYPVGNSLVSMRSEDIVLEVKGDIGIGIWSQYINKRVEDMEDKNSIVLGGDYSFDINGNFLYTVAESIYLIEDKKASFYLMYNYTLGDDIVWSQGTIFDGEFESKFITNNLTYVYNDYVDIKIAYNYYDNFSGVGLTTNNTSKLKDEVVFEIRGYI